FAPAAAGTPPLTSISATPIAGEAPLRVTFSAGGDTASDHWDFGDESSADGQTVEHTYAAGRWTATVTARSAGGESTTQSVAVTAYGLTLAGPNPVRYARRAVFRGSVIPAERGLPVELVGPAGKLAAVRTRSDGSYVIGARITVPGSYLTTSERASAPP